MDPWLWLSWALSARRKPQSEGPLLSLVTWDMRTLRITCSHLDRSPVVLADRPSASKDVPRSPTGQLVSWM